MQVHILLLRENNSNKKYNLAVRKCRSSILKKKKDFTKDLNVSRRKLYFF